jgi:hypothetical protein
VSLILALLAGTAAAEGIPFIVIDQSLVANKMLPVGTEVKIKVLQISDQFNAYLTVVCFPESPFKAGTPGTVGVELKQWLAKDLQVGDVLRYITTRRGFIGFAVGPDYRKQYLEKLERGYRVTLDYNTHRWQFEASFPDYD